jgi:hypothetical protein
VIYRGRTDGMNQWKTAYASDTSARTLEDALNGADVFVGLSAKGAVTREMVKRMAPKPLIFRHGQSRSRDHAGRSARSALGRDRRYGTFGLSEPDQQRVWAFRTSSAARSMSRRARSTKR